MKSRKGLFLFLAVLLVSSFFLSRSYGGTTTSTSYSSAGSICGKVYDERTLKPIPGAVVTISSCSFSRSARTDTNGMYSITGCPTDEEVHIRCRRMGYRSYSAVIASSSSDTYTHDIPLKGLIPGFGTSPDDTVTDGKTGGEDEDKEYIKDLDLKPKDYKRDKPDTGQGVFKSGGEYPDMVITKFYMDEEIEENKIENDPELPIGNRSHTVILQAKNIGDTYANAVSVTVRKLPPGGDQALFFDSAGGVDPGEELDYEIECDDFDIDPGEYLMYCDVSLCHRRPEKPETMDNNKKEGTVTFVEGHGQQPPAEAPSVDLKITSLFVDGEGNLLAPNPPRDLRLPRGEHLLGMTVRNKFVTAQLGGPLVNFADIMTRYKFKITNGRGRVYEGEGPVLGNGDPANPAKFYARHQFDEPGIYTIEASIDPVERDQAHEEDGNNTLRGKLTIEGGPHGPVRLDHAVTDLEMAKFLIVTDPATGQTRDIRRGVTIEPGNRYEVRGHIRNHGPDESSVGRCRVVFFKNNNPVLGSNVEIAVPPPDRHTDGPFSSSLSFRRPGRVLVKAVVAPIEPDVDDQPKNNFIEGWVTVEEEDDDEDEDEEEIVVDLQIMSLLVDNTVVAPNLQRPPSIDFRNGQHLPGAFIRNGGEPVRGRNIKAAFYLEIDGDPIMNNVAIVVLGNGGRIRMGRPRQFNQRGQHFIKASIKPLPPFTEPIHTRRDNMMSGSFILNGVGNENLIPNIDLQAAGLTIEGRRLDGNTVTLPIPGGDGRYNVTVAVRNGGPDVMAANIPARFQLNLTRSGAGFNPFATGGFFALPAIGDNWTQGYRIPFRNAGNYEVRATIAGGQEYNDNDRNNELVGWVVIQGGAQPPPPPVGPQPGPGGGGQQPGPGVQPRRGLIPLLQFLGGGGERPEIQYGAKLPEEEQEEPVPSRRPWPWWLLLLLYIYLSLSLHVIAKKTSITPGWLAWIPIINISLMCKIAGRPGWWFWLFLVPFVNIVVAVMVWMGISKARNKADWLGLLLLVPVVNLILLGYLAFSK